jgi:hypothetical protein
MRAAGCLAREDRDIRSRAEMMIALLARVRPAMTLTTEVWPSAVEPTAVTFRETDFAVAGLPHTLPR